MRCIRLCLPALLLAAARAAEPPAPLIGDLAQFAGGKPVPIVAVAAWDGAVRRSGPAPSTVGKAWLPSLQAIAEAASGQSESAIPFSFGPMWTVAPDEMWVSRLPVGPFDPLTSMTGDRLLQLLASSLTPEQMAAVSAEGLTWEDFTEQQQRLLSAAFDRPGCVASSFVWASGRPEVRSTPLPGGVFPIRRARIRMGLAFQSLRVPAEDGGYGSSYFLTNAETRLRFPAPASAIVGGEIALDSRALAPAKLKPQGADLGAAAFSAPIGIAGAVTVGEAVAAAAKATGLPLSVDKRFADKPAFVGDAGQRSGDVMKALAFDLTAAWRRVGRRLYLAWDTLGFAAFDTLHRETVQPLLEASRAIGATVARAGWQADALQRVGPRPETQFGPTPDQLMRLSQPPTSAAGQEGASIPFAELTQSQQTAIRAAVPALGEPELRRASVGWIILEAVAEAPGLPPVLLGGSGMGALDPARARTFVSQRAKGDWPPKNLPGEGTIRLPQAIRALAPPLLPRGEWPRLLNQMRRKGLNTLYFPVLWDGHSTFPGKAFPLAPEARGGDLLADVSTRAKGMGIRVVGVIHALAWRFPGGAETHWLRKHPEWVDVDVAGRTRRDWATPERLRSPSAGVDWSEDPIAYSDMANPALPAVRARLLAFCAELRAHGGLDGVALAHWTRGAGREYPGSRMPMLGYSAAAREEFLAKYAEDIADIPMEPYMPGQATSPFGPFDQSLLFSPARDRWRGQQWDVEVGLVEAMETDLRRAWKTGVHAFNPYEAAIPAPNAAKRLEADTLISSTATARNEYRWLPAPKPADPISGYLRTVYGEEMSRAQEDRAARAAVRLQRLTGPSAASLGGVVLDFTTGPDLMWNALRLLSDRVSRP